MSHEQLFLLPTHLVVEDIVRLVVAQCLCLFTLEGAVALVDGEAEGGGEVVVAPHLANFHLEVQTVVARHEPHDDGHRGSHEGKTPRNVTPRQVGIKIDIHVHYS